MQWVLIAGYLLSGCTAPAIYDRGSISDELNARTGAPLSSEAFPQDFTWPPGILVEDGLSADEAAATALWNNANLEQRLAELGWAKADYVAANLFPNPSIILHFPGGPKTFDAILALPIDLLARSSRIRRSRFEVEKGVALVQEEALALVREARVAHTDWMLARRRVELLRQFAGLMADMAEIATAQEEVGRISTRLAAQARANAADIAGQSIQAEAAERTAGNHLAQLIGFPSNPETLQLQASPVVPPVLACMDDLLMEALTSRPELRAAETAMLAAGAEAGFARASLLDFVARLNVIETKGEGVQYSPGGQLVLPIFNQNQGPRLRAEASMERAVAGYVAAQRLVRQQVNDALAAFTAADRSYSIWRDDVVPARQLEAELSEAAYELGRVSYFDWAVSQTNFVQAQLSLVDAEAALQRAYADIERSLGKRTCNEG